MRVNIDLTNIHNTINDTFYPLLTDKNRYLLLRGSAGSGKSRFAIEKILIRILIGLSNNTVHKILCVRKTQPALRRSVFALLKQYIYDWGLERLCKVNSSDMVIQWVNGSQILCVGLDNPDKLKSIEGITSIFCEEATELNGQDAMQLDLRLRGRHNTYHQIIYAFNPIGRNNYIYKMFYEKEHEDTTLHFSTWRDNRWLDEQYTDMLRSLKEKDYNMYLIYSEGKWGELENLIFNNWDIIDSIPSKYTNSDAVFGADWGFIHKTSIVRVIKDGDDIFVKEEYYKDKQTNLDTINWIKEYLPDEALIFGDSAEPARITEARRSDINMRSAKKGPNSVKDSIDFLKRYKIHITKDSIGLIQEMGSYKWRQSKDGTVEEKPVDFNDDAIAAFRYASWTRWGNTIDYKVYTGE